MTSRLYREEALLVGPSTGAIVHAAATLTDLEGPVVTISPDGGFKYASFFAQHLRDDGTFSPTLIDQEEQP
jgi:cysteine synthase